MHNDFYVNRKVKEIWSHIEMYTCDEIKISQEAKDYSKNYLSGVMKEDGRYSCMYSAQIYKVSILISLVGELENISNFVKMCLSSNDTSIVKMIIVLSHKGFNAELFDRVISKHMQKPAKSKQDTMRSACSEYLKRMTVTTTMLA